MKRCSLRRAAGVAVLAWSAAAASVAQAQVDTAKSWVSAVVKQMGVPTENRFKKFDAQITFDPAKPAAASAQVDIDTASYDLGDAAYDQEARGEAWFDTKKYPKATFKSTSVAPAGDNKYSMAGRLTIKGKTADVMVPVSVSTQGGQQVFDGELPISRLQYNVGTGEWKDTSVVDDKVIIKFHLVAAKH